MERNVFLSVFMFQMFSRGYFISPSQAILTERIYYHLFSNKETGLSSCSHFPEARQSVSNSANQSLLVRAREKDEEMDKPGRTLDAGLKTTVCV